MTDRNDGHLADLASLESRAWTAIALYEDKLREANGAKRATGMPKYQMQSSIAFYSGIVRAVTIARACLRGESLDEAISELGLQPPVRPLHKDAAGVKG